MKKILITGLFIGVVEIRYHIMGCGLTVIDFSGAELRSEQKIWFMKYIPPVYGEGFEQRFPEKAKLSFVVEDMEIDFMNDFWWPYGKPINLKRCQKYWANLTKVNRIKAVFGLTGYLWYLEQKQWRTKVDPENYFKKRMWETDWYKVID